MSAFAQFDAGYNLEQDRILLRITNTDGEEYRLWLTRRMCASLLTDFKAKTSSYRVKKDPSRPHTQTAIAGAETVMQADFEQQAAAQSQDFTTKFKPGTRFPLGEAGLLVEKLNLQPNGKGEGVHALSFYGAEDKGMTIGLTMELFNSIFEVLERIIARTDWGLLEASVNRPPSSTLQ